MIPEAPRASRRSPVGHAPVVRLGLLAGAALLLPALAPPPGAEEVVRRVGKVTFRVDTSQAWPGGVFAVRLGSRVRLGAAWALLDGRRAPFYSDGGVPRALVPVSLAAEPGPATLGVAIAARGGEQRVAIPIAIARRDYRPRSVFLAGPEGALLVLPDAARDGRRLLALLRTESPKPAPGLLLPPVDAAGGGFGEVRTYSGAADVESRTDALQGERHRGLDYAVPSGTPVRAPAAGTILHAGPLVLTGETVVIDHGQGVVSALLHLSRTGVRPGDLVAAGDGVGASGDTGIATEPLLQWRVYLHGVPVDPNALAALL